MEVEVIKRKANEKDENGNLVNKLKVCAYARVSTDMEEQQTSFISQQKYYLDKITSNPNWIFVEVYADEGISGTQAFKRENFMRMIKDAEDGKIDLILTKSISRFARNTLDTLKYVRLTKANGVGIIFEEEGINTMDMAGELLLTVLSSVAQQESETISSHVKLGLKMKRERGEITGFSSCYGLTYDYKKKEMIINHEEAKVIKMIFNLYMKGYGTGSIANSLTEMKIMTPTGKDKWHPSSIMRILRNEKYKGDVIQGKTYTLNPITHETRVNNGEEDKYYIKDHHEAIIDREIFDAVQNMLDEKSDNKSGIYKGRKSISYKSPFSGKIRCGFCGKSFTKRSNNKNNENGHWACMTTIRSAKSICPDSKSIPEKTIKKAFMESFKLLSENNGLVMDDFLKIIKESLKIDDPLYAIKKLESDKATYKNNLSKLIDLYVSGEMDQELLKKKQDEIQMKIDRLNIQIAEYQASNGNNKYENLVHKIKRQISARESLNEIQSFDSELFNRLVDYIIIGGYDEMNNANEYLIRFICRNGFDSKSREDITEETIINNGLNVTTQGIYANVLDFIMNDNITVFEIKNNSRNKKIIEKVRVRVEFEV